MTVPTNENTIVVLSENSIGADDENVLKMEYELLLLEHIKNLEDKLKGIKKSPLSYLFLNIEEEGGSIG